VTSGGIISIGLVLYLLLIAPILQRCRART